MNTTIKKIKKPRGVSKADTGDYSVGARETRSRHSQMSHFPYNAWGFHPEKAAIELF